MQITESVAIMTAFLAFSPMSGAEPSARRGEVSEQRTAGPDGGSRWAVVVGVDEYKDREIARLEGAVNDANAIAGALSRYAHFSSQQVFTLTSAAIQKPTAAAILDTLDEIKHAAKPGDLLLFFFAGHGVEMEGQRYLLTYEASYESAGTLKRTTLPASQLMQELQSIRVAHRIVMIDACRDDPINPNRRQPSAATAALEAAFTLQPSAEEGARANYLSSTRGQNAYEWREMRRGFFSYFIEKGLSGEAAAFGKVTLTSLAGYLNEFVPRAVREQRGKEQKPFRSLDGEDLVLVDGVGLNGGRTPSGAGAGAAPPATRTVYGMVKDSNGAPITGAIVRVASAGGASRAMAASPTATQELVATADDDGFFKAEVPRDATVTITAGGTGGFGLGSMTSSPGDSGKKVSLFLPRSLRVVAPDTNPTQELAKVAYQSFLVEEFDAAERAAQSAIAMDPRNALAQAVLANCLAVHGVNRRDGSKLTSARGWAEAVLRAQPPMALAHNAMGLVLYGSGDIPGAQREFLTALKLEPNLSVAGANLGQSYYDLRQYPQAERAFRDAIRSRPEAAVPYNGLAQVLLAQGRPVEAVQVALDGVSRYELQDSYLGRFYVNLALALHLAGRGRPALEAVARAKTLGVSGNPTIEMIERSPGATNKR